MCQPSYWRKYAHRSIAAFLLARRESACRNGNGIGVLYKYGSYKSIEYLYAQLLAYNGTNSKISVSMFPSQNPLRTCNRLYVGSAREIADLEIGNSVGTWR